MIHQFNVNSNADIEEQEDLLRSIISLFSSDWKEYVIEWAHELDMNEYKKCPECEENVHNDDLFCRWCGYALPKNGYRNNNMEKYK